MGDKKLKTKIRNRQVVIPSEVIQVEYTEKTGFQTVSQKYEHGTDPGIQVNDNPVFGRDKQVGIQRSQTPV